MNELDINEIRKEVEEKTKIKEEILGYERKIEEFENEYIKTKKSLDKEKEINYEEKYKDAEKIRLKYETEYNIILKNKNIQELKNKINILKDKLKSQNDKKNELEQKIKKKEEAIKQMEKEIVEITKNLGVIKEKVNK